VLEPRGAIDLPFVIVFPACDTDSRANRLEKWSSRPAGSATLLLMCTASDVVDHLAANLTHLGFKVSRVEMDDPEDRKLWTHGLEVNAKPIGRVEDLLNLLAGTLVLRRPDGLESAMVLDWYKDPSSHDDPNKWAFTEVGKLVYGAKYRSDVARMRGLCDRLADVIQRHPIYRECVLATVPGHNAAVVSAGERVAAGVAKRTGQELIKTVARTKVRPEAKAGEAFDLSGEFKMDEQASLRGVLIVDDLYRSGKTMSAVAAAAKRAGALSVHGIAGVRTMRK
jgi:hypothetical protein